jgi:hypothetical protein
MAGKVIIKFEVYILFFQILFLAHKEYIT